MASPRLAAFLAFLHDHRSMFWRSVADTIAQDPEGFERVAEPMVEWAATYLGDATFAETLVDGYIYLVVESNTSQRSYQKLDRYPHSSYADLFDATYGNEEFMSKYHWGVYVATFAWPHHIRIHKFFEREFLPLLGNQGRLVDIGSGSGVWSKFALSARPDWLGVGVDISETSVRMANDMAGATGLASRLTYIVGDALDWRADPPADAAISSFLLEHLEEPRHLFVSLAANLAPAGHAFVTCALTASEIDHIAEFRRESELVLMAEEAGFRVVTYVSSPPSSVSPKTRLVPRSMAMLLQKRIHDTW
jgi:SAM-dependent methyltransferase